MGIIIEQKSNAYVLADDTKQRRWVDAFGAGVVKYVLDGPQYDAAASSDPAGWTLTEVEAGAGDTVVSPGITAGVSMLITNAGNEYDGCNMQRVGTPFCLETGKPLYFGASLTISNATESDLLVGLCETKTDLLATGAAHAINSPEGIFFCKLDNSTTASFYTYIHGGTQGNVAAYGTAIDTTATVYEFYWDGSAAYGYINDTLVGHFTSNFPAGLLTPSINFRNGGAVVRTCTINWIKCFELRG